MHGDETVGREILIRFIHYLCSNYNRTSEEGVRVTKLIDSTDIYIIPSMNPDGFEYGRRANGAFKDLNRNFPDLRFPGRETQGGHGPEPETVAIMEWSQQHHFVLSANFHGGALVANYPYDGNNQRGNGIIEKTPDHTRFQQLASIYANAHTSMHRSAEFTGGITNGAQWYTLYGGMQDWNYEALGCMEVTLEVSNTKYPQVDSLNSYWSENLPAMLAYLEQVHTGLVGTVEDKQGQPLSAHISVAGNARKVSTNPKHGDYYRLLATGTYNVTAISDGYRSQTREVTIQNQQPFSVERLDFKLERN